MKTSPCLQEQTQYHQESFLELFVPEKPVATRTVRRKPIPAESENLSADAKKLEGLLTKICMRIGMPMHMRGYAMLRLGVLAAVEETDLVFHLTHGLYARLAKVFHCTEACVERDIRNVICVTWERGAPEEAARLLGAAIRPGTGKPTNGVLISLLAERLRMEINEP